MNKFIEVPANANSISSRRLVYGVGINDADYVVTSAVNGRRVICPFYKKWADMLMRCYDPYELNQLPAYRGVTICKEWLTFSNFKAWMIKRKWEGLEIDKDIISPGNKVYSPENCCFVPKALNGLLNDHGRARGEWPRGVTCNAWHNNTFRARCWTLEGKRKSLGCFKTPKEAAQAYRVFKYFLVREIAVEQVCPELRCGLMKHAGLILRGVEL